MWRSVLSFAYGLLIAALCTSAVSVYIFHDVDRDQVGNLNAAFTGLCFESVLFTAIISLGVLSLIALAKLLFHVAIGSARATMSFILGVGVVLLQYPCEFAVRRAAPRFDGSALLIYVLFAIVVSSAILLFCRLKPKDRQGVS